MHSDSTTINAPKKNGMFSVASPLLRLNNRQDPSTHLHLLYRNSSSTAFKHWALLWVPHPQCFLVQPFCLTGKVMLQKMKRRILQDCEELSCCTSGAPPKVILAQGFLQELCAWWASWIKEAPTHFRAQAKTADVKASLNHSWEGITVQEESEPLQVLPSLCQGLHKQESSPPHPGIL